MKRNFTLSEFCFCMTDGLSSLSAVDVRTVWLLTHCSPWCRCLCVVCVLLEKLAPCRALSCPEFGIPQPWAQPCSVPAGAPLVLSCLCTPTRSLPRLISLLQWGGHARNVRMHSSLYPTSNLLSTFWVSFKHSLHPPTPDIAILSPYSHTPPHLK